MHLDKYLKVSRLIKRRTVANDACDNERVMVNGRVQRASYDVKPGDRIAISASSVICGSNFTSDASLKAAMAAT